MTKLTRRSFIAATAATIATISRTPQTNAASLVDYMWSGALQPNSIRVSARTYDDSNRVRLIASTRPDLQNPIFSGSASASQGVNNRVAKLGLSNLSPNTHYHYGIEVDGVIDNRRGKFRTPAVGAQSFSFAFASCGRTGSTHRVFDTIRNLNPLFFMHMGDMHYADIPTNERDKYRWAFGQVHGSPQQSRLYRSLPLAYMWDDHDYGPNDSNGEFIGREAARLSYQETVPHYPLVAGSGNVPIYQAFTIGRVRFIMTDTRSERDSNAVSADSPQKSMLGAAQKAWLKNELRNANGRFPVIVWMCTSPWLADSPGSGTDNWNGFRSERREMADFIEQNEIRGLFYITGDLHALAIDDGSNNLYASSGNPSFPIMIGAALDQSGSFFRTNTYSLGQYPNGGQFGLMTINDNGGDDVSITWSGRNADNREIVGTLITPSSVVFLPTVSHPPMVELAANKREVVLTATAGSRAASTATLDVAGSGQQWQLIEKPNKPWLTISPTSGTAPAQLRFTADPSGLPAGVHATSIEVRDVAQRRSIWLPVKLIVKASSS